MTLALRTWTTCAVTVAAATAAAILPGATNAASSVTTVQAEGLSINAKSGNAFKDGRAAGEKALMLKRKSSITATYDGTVERLTLRVRGTSCGGAPKLRARLDGKVLGTRTIKRTRWMQVRFSIKDQTSAQHRISVAFANPKAGRHCRRALRIDWVSYRGAPQLTVGVSEGPGSDSADPPAPTTPVKVTTPPADASPSAPNTPTVSGITRLFVDPDTDAAEWAAANRKSRPADAALMDKLAKNAGSQWMGGYSGEFNLLDKDFSRAAADKSRVVVVVYGIPNRDGGQYSAGGLKDEPSYKAWIDQIAAHIRNRAAIVIVEPDAIPMNMPDAVMVPRYRMVSYAVSKLSALSDTKVYLDAGTPGWRTPEYMIPRLKAAGVDAGDGISVNTSNFRFTNESVAWGRQVLAGIGPKGMVIDTSRNGNGPVDGGVGEQRWCNPPGRALGFRPTMATGIANVDAFLWMKSPGHSDGACFGHPAAGVFEPAVGLELARNAAW